VTWPTDHPFWSYRLAKFEMAGEKRGLGRLRFAAFERKLDARLAALLPSLSSADRIFRDIDPGRVRLRPKSFEMTPREDATQSFVRIPERPTDLEIQTIGVRVMIESTPEFATSEVVWLRAYGALLEATLSPTCRGNRLDLYGTPPHLHVQGRRIFKYWAPAYRDFRADAITEAKKALKERAHCHLIALDITSYYDNIDPSFLTSRSFVKKLERAANVFKKPFIADEYTSATNGLLDAFSRFRNRVKKTVGVECQTGIPIGCLTSRLISNLALSKMDFRVTNHPLVTFYGRYVDDIVMVVDPVGAESSSTLALLEKVLPVDRSRSTDKKIILDESLLRRSGSSFVIQSKKLRIFDLKGDAGLEYLGAVDKELNRASSDRRRFLEPADDAADRTVAVSNSAEPITTLREADALSLRRLAVNSVCSKVVTSAIMLSGDEAAKYSRTHLGVAGRLATDWSRWVEMVDVALYILAAALTSGDGTTANEVVSALLERVDSLHGDQTATIRWGRRRLRHDLASKLIEKWILAQLRETLAASLPLGQSNSFLMIVLKEALLRVEAKNKRLTRRRLIQLGNRLAITDLRFVDREADLALGTIRPLREEASIAALKAEVVRDPFVATRYGLLETFINACAEIADPVFSNVSPIDITLMHRPPSYADILFRWLRAERPLVELIDIVNAVRGTRYPYTPMLESGGEIAVNADRGMISGPTGVGSTRLVLGNLCTEDSWWISSLTTPVRTQERQRRVARIINEALHAAQRSRRKGVPALLVLPELSLPRQWLRAVANHLIFQAPYLSIVTGLEYKVIGNKVFNEAVAVVPRGFSMAAAWVWTKGRPASLENSLLVKEGYRFSTRGKSRRFAVMSTEHGRFAPLICSELLEVDSKAKLLNRIDIVIVPAWNPDLLTFEYLVHATSLDLHSFVAVANNGIYSDCRVRGPYAEHWRRDACRLISRGENEIVVADIPVDFLREFRADPSAYKERIESWKKIHKAHDKCPWPIWKPPPPK
jgi:Reverse transcriptase (RNA-dependent DNA polymerase)